MDKLVSIVIPCYNSASTVSETIDSVLNQTYKDIEIVLVDDGSVDNIQEEVKPYLEKYPFVHYFYQVNQGQSVARNKGAGLCTGYYLLFLDSDDKIAETYIEKCVDVLENDSAVKLVHSNGFYFGAVEGDWFFPEYKFRNFLIGNMIHILAMMRKNDFQEAGGFDTLLSYYEDWDLWIKILKNNGKFVLIEEQLFYYRKHESQTSLTDNIKRDKERDSKNKQRVYNNNIDAYTKVFGTPIDMLQELFALEVDYYLAQLDIEYLRKKNEKRLSKRIRRFFNKK